MDNTLLWSGFGVLLIAVNLNLWLSFRLFQALKYVRVRQEASMNNTTEHALGADIPAFQATTLTTGHAVSSIDYPDYAKVLIYLSSQCVKCKSKLPELEATIQSIEDAGVKLWIVSYEPARRVTDFLSSEVLQSATLLLEEPHYAALNPQFASPFYQFVDQQNTLQAQGLIGDENWQGFREQLQSAA